MKDITVTSIGLDIESRLLLQSLISLVRTHDRGGFEYIDQSEADIMFIDIDKLAIPRVRGSDQIQVMVSDADRSEDFTFFLKKIVRASDLRKMLVKLIERHQGVDFMSGNKTEVMKNNGVVAPDQDDMSAILNLLIPEETRSLTEISSQGYPTVLIDRENKKVYLKGVIERLFTYRSVTRSALSSRHLKSNDIPSVGSELKVYSAENTFWQMGLNLSGENLLINLRPFKTFRLKRWPDFGRLLHTSTSVKMASRLMMNPLSVQDLIASLNIEKSEVVAFLNACYLCDWLVPVDADNAYQKKWLSVKKSNHRQSGLFSKIRTKLGIGARF